MPVTTPENQHLPVLKDEIVGLLDRIDGGTIIDATLGLGGHSEAILDKYPNFRVIGFDQDSEAIHLAGKRLLKFKDRIEFVNTNFSQIENVVQERSITDVEAVIADLGVSSMQLDSETRGFSFRFDSPLDMRMDSDAETETAADLLASLRESEIADIIYQFGEVRHSRRIARRIVAERKAGRPVQTTKQLASLVAGCVPRRKNDTIHPATRTFQALRIAVNGELELLNGFVNDAVEVLRPGGVLAVISFHSLEDRIVKTAFQRLSGKCFCPPKIPKCVCGATKSIEILTRRPVIPDEQEMRMNPRSRSAKLRAARKVSIDN